MPTYNLRNLKVKPQETKTKDKEKVEFENIDNSTKTSQIYKSREAYKKQVNDENLPIGLKNKNDKKTNECWRQPSRDFSNSCCT